VCIELDSGFERLSLRCDVMKCWKVSGSGVCWFTLFYIILLDSYTILSSFQYSVFSIS
jgi:hypothetical protein